MTLYTSMTPRYQVCFDMRELEDMLLALSVSSKHVDCIQRIRLARMLAALQHIKECT